MKKVLVIIPTNDYVEDECYESILKQDYKAFSVIINIVREPVPACQADKSVRSTINRNIAKQMALASIADYFMFVDSDTVLPPGAITSLALQLEKAEKDIVGGWYRPLSGTNWVGGRYVADYVFSNFQHVQPSLILTDMVGLGCVMMTRKVLSEVAFESGLDMRNDKKGIYAGPCLKFSENAHAKGYTMYLDSSVVCGHIERKKRVIET